MHAFQHAHADQLLDRHAHARAADAEPFGQLVLGRDLAADRPLAALDMASQVLSTLSVTLMRSAFMAYLLNLSDKLCFYAAPFSVLSGKITFLLHKIRRRFRTFPAQKSRQDADSHYPAVFLQCLIPHR